MNTEKKLYQWDIGQKLAGCTGLYVDFLIDNEVYRVETADGMCIIPDELLQTSGKHKVYECMTNNTIRSFAFSVIPRPMPPDYVFTPTERLTFEGLVQKVDDAVADMIRRAESGEFDGHTPVKGTDYFTTEEIQQIQNEVSSGAIGEFKSVVDIETDKFNANATEKVNTYNQNDSQKTTSYNANATAKLNAYNTNANNRVAEFDSHTEQIQTDIGELKSDLADLIDDTGIEVSVKREGSATSGNTAWAKTFVIRNISLKANTEYSIIVSSEVAPSLDLTFRLDTSNGSKLTSFSLLANTTIASASYTPSENYENCDLYFQYGKTDGFSANAIIDVAYYPQNYVMTSFNSGIEGGFAFELINSTENIYTNYYMFKFEKSMGDRFYLELKDKIGIQDINILAKYKDGTVGILCGLTESKPKKEITLEKGIIGIGAYLPANYKNTLYVYSDFRNSVLERMKNVSFENSAFGSFAKFGVVGDSLSVGYMGDSSGTAHGRNIYYSWGQVLARRYGNKCLNFGFSGATTETWYTNEKHGKVELVQEQNKCQAYVVGLGVNDTVAESNVGNANDINLSDYTQNANTFYGNYAKVLQTIMETAPTAYIFVFTIPKTKGTNRFSEIKNNAIKGVVAKLASDRVFVIETNEYSELFNLDVITDNSYSSHYTAIGYANIATINAIMLSDCMNSNADKLKDIAFIPYGNNDVIN